MDLPTFRSVPPHPTPPQSGLAIRRCLYLAVVIDPIIPRDPAWKSYTFLAPLNENWSNFKHIA